VRSRRFADGIRHHAASDVIAAHRAFAGQHTLRHSTVTRLFPAPLAGSVYDGFSPKGQRALAELRAAFKEAGFYAEKERRTERTLRVYPERRGKYPLLNPSIVASKRDSPVPVDAPSMLCPIYSDGDETITRLLTSLPSIDGCRFVPLRRKSGRYHLHGYVVFRLSFVDSPRRRIIDFAPLHAPLSSLYFHLSSLGFAAPRGLSATRGRATQLQLRRTR